jgi:hypothetical protein
MENLICILLKIYSTMLVSYLSFFVLGMYFTLLIILAFILSPKKRRDFKGKTGYEEALHVLVISRQILLFLLPLMVSFAVFGVSFTSDQLLSLVILGLSINVFWVTQMPLLTKAQLAVDFSVDQLTDFHEGIILVPKTKQVIYLRIQNLGYSTLKNGTILLYLGDQFEKNKCQIIPSSNSAYDELDFKKTFRIQKAHAGVSITPNDNFITIPPQEWFVFPVLVEISDCELNSQVEVEFYSENSWGITKYHASIETKNEYKKD